MVSSCYFVLFDGKCFWYEMQFSELFDAEKCNLFSRIYIENKGFISIEGCFELLFFQL